MLARRLMNFGLMTSETSETKPSNEEESAAEVNPGMQIPHNSVHLEGDILSNHQVATDYAHMMTRDLHTPLNVIVGMCEFLEHDPERPLTTSQQDAVKRIDRIARSLLKTVNDVLQQLRSEH